MEIAKTSSNAMTHLSKDEDVRVEALIRICGILNCAIDDILEPIPE